MKGIVLLLAACLSNAAFSAQLSIDERCGLLAKRHISQMQQGAKRDYTLVETSSFYSEKYDSCILVEKAMVGVEVFVRDLTKTILLDGGENFNVLLHCDVDGADSVVLEKVRAQRGRVFEVPYKEWLDDGFGGPPRTLKAPINAYTKAKCESVLQKWISVLK